MPKMAPNPINSFMQQDKILHDETSLMGLEIFGSYDTKSANQSIYKKMIVWPKKEEERIKEF